MDLALPERPCRLAANPFDLEDAQAYRRWREWKLACRPERVEDLLVGVRDARALAPAELKALRTLIQGCGYALYRSAHGVDDRALPRLLGAQLGLHRLDANWLADEDGISRITVSDQADGQGGFIPYTDMPIRWHTDGYYHPQERRIRGMILHCVRPALRGGENTLLDPELAYIALRDESPTHVRALMQHDAMTIPERTDETGVARAAQTGPVFSVDEDGGLHMRYTARTRSIQWKDDASTRAAVARLQELLGDASFPGMFRVRLQAGMGLVGRNVLHDRSGFHDDPAQPRLLLRARFLDGVAAGEEPWRNG